MVGGNNTVGVGGNNTVGVGVTIQWGWGVTIQWGWGVTIQWGWGETIQWGWGVTILWGWGVTILWGWGVTIQWGWEGNNTVMVGGNNTVGVGGNNTVGVGGNNTVGVGGNNTVGVGGNNTVGVGGNNTVGGGSVWGGLGGFIYKEGRKEGNVLFNDTLIGRTGKLTHSPVWIGLSDSKVTVQWGGGGVGGECVWGGVGGFIYKEGRKEGNVLFNDSLSGRNGKLTHSPVWIGLSDSKVTIQRGVGGGVSVCAFICL